MLPVPELGGGLLDTLTRDTIRSLLWPRGDGRPFRRPTYWVIAQDLGVSPAAVRTRLSALYEMGALKTIRIIPDVSYFDLDRSIAIAEVTGETSRNLKAKTELFDFVEATHLSRTYYPQSGLNYASVVILHRGQPDLERKLRLVEEVVGDLPIMHRASFTRRAVSKGLTFRTRDLLMELIEDPLARITELAERLGCSRKTAKRHLDVLVERRAFHVEPEFDSSRFEGAMPFVVVGLLEEIHRGRVESEFRQKLRESYMLFRSYFQDVLMFACWADDFHEVEACYQKVLEVRGLENPMVLLPFETVGNPSVRYQ